MVVMNNNVVMGKKSEIIRIAKRLEIEVPIVKNWEDNTSIACLIYYSSIKEWGYYEAQCVVIPEAINFTKEQLKEALDPCLFEYNPKKRLINKIIEKAPGKLAIKYLEWCREVTSK